MNQLIQKVTRKSFTIRSSGRSTDFISPSFGFGCVYNCSYCYMKRHKPKGLDIANNPQDILTAVNNHVWFADVEKPNQTHPSYVTYDISCNEDFALHAKFHDWEYIFDYFRDHPLAMGSFATKYVNKKLLDYNPEGKIRIRFSLMPQSYANLLEPNTSSIEDRLQAVKLFQDAGYEVHLNFSPVIVCFNWLQEYEQLFKDVREYAITYNWDNDSVKAEVIFLTHNKSKHIYNTLNDITGEDLIWRPDIQESKISQYGGENLRYQHTLKAEYIRQFTKLHDSIISWNTIRYIF